MPATAVATQALILAATTALSAAATAAAIAYARRRRMIDLPGRRRSHDQPTPRGGGIAIVATIVVAWSVLALHANAMKSWLLVVPPMLAIALAGWIDDHRGLSTRWRLAIHFAAAIWLLGGALAPALSAAQATPAFAWTSLIALLALVVAVSWSINLHNFMDGINGLLTLQSMFVLSALAFLAGAATAPALAALVVVAACAGFLPFNFPRARVFMGDVGSGALGFVIALFVLWFALTPRMSVAGGIVLCSAFVTDATCTLLSRMLRGRRWYSAHREHLYQWLVRSGFPHAGVVALYMGWNLLVALPVAFYMNRTPQIPMPAGLVPAIAVYALAIAAWWCGKRWCLRRVRERSSHAAA